MNYRYIYTSLTRISDLQCRPFEIKPLAKKRWATGDYVAAEIIHPGSGAAIELPNGRMMEPLRGERIIGALGIRHATLEATGTWEEVDTEGEMHVLTGAGLFGKMTSRSVFSPIPIKIKYLGHILRKGKKCTMSKAVKSVPKQLLETSVVLLVGTSMSAGKTTTGRLVVKQLKSFGLKVLGTKLSGAGRYRDIIALKDAGADEILDFVDAGLPSTVCPSAEYHLALDNLISRMAGIKADVAVVEIGASPLEPYNGDQAIQRIREHVKCKILCASDPYAVYGVMHSYNFIPDMVSGPTTNTIAAVELSEKLCGVRAVNLLLPENHPILEDLLREKLRINETNRL